MQFGLFAMVAVVGVLIGLAKTGFAGFAALNTPLLTEAANAPFAIGVTLPMLICGDILVGWRFFGLWDRRVVAVMVPGCVVGVIIASPLLRELAAHEVLFNRAIGIVALSFTILQMVLTRRRDRDEEVDDSEAPPPAPWVGFTAGLLTAVVSTIAHQGGLVSNLYLISQRLTKERFAATATGVYFTLNTIKLVPYVQTGTINAETMRYSLAAMPFVLVGVLVGAKLIAKMSSKAFTWFILWVVVVLGLKLTIWP